MSEYRLLIAAHVVDLLFTIRKTERDALRSRFEEIRANPANFCDYVEKDDVGRDLDVHVFKKHAIVFWCDTADRHIKVLDILPSDRPR